MSKEKWLYASHSIWYSGIVSFNFLDFGGSLMEVIYPSYALCPTHLGVRVCVCVYNNLLMLIKNSRFIVN